MVLPGNLLLLANKEQQAQLAPLVRLVQQGRLVLKDQLEQLVLLVLMAQ
jgi:hypothetical protein